MIDKNDFVDIPGYEGLYATNRNGDIYSYYKNKMHAIRLRLDGYKDTDLTKNKKTKKFLIHRLLAKIFIPNPQNKLYINHIDGNKSNNSIENLEWVTSSENALHASNNGLREKQKQIAGQYSIMHFRKLTDSQVDEAKRIYANGEADQVKLGKKYNVSSATICRAINGKTYKQRSVFET